MALVSNGIIITAPASSLPSAYVKPTDAVLFTDFDYSELNLELIISKSSVQNAVSATTMQNIVNSVISTVESKLTSDYNCTDNTVQYYINLKSVLHNYQPNLVEFTTGTINFYCIIDIFVKVEAV
jgi:hypothetical protein